jgi:hypothetical protein
MSPERFQKRYEEGHAPLVKEILPHFAAYTRSYPRRVLMLRAGETDIGFGALTQMWQDSAEQSERTMAIMLDPVNAGHIAEDEAALFDRSALLSFPVTEIGAAPDVSSPHQPKIVVLYDKSADLSAAEFQDRAEGELVPRVLALRGAAGRPLVVESRRNYLVPHTPYHLPSHPKAVQAMPEAVLELWLGGEGDLEAFVAAMEAGALETGFASVRAVVVVEELGDRPSINRPSINQSN